MRLKGKVAIVTGGAKGIGKAYSLGLAKEGAKVCVVDIDFEAAQNTVDEIKRLGGEAFPIKVDISDEAETEHMAKACFERYGSIDILVNNAAYYIQTQRGPWNEISIEEWRRIMSVNVVGMWLCCKAVFPYMRKKGKGKIINISSETALESPVPGFIHYVTSKGAVIAFTRALAKEVGDYGINVNTVTPGLVVTEATSKLYPPETFQRARERRCIKRDEYPEDLVGAIIFLASDGSDFITGQIINVNGGAIMH
jgi:3-oxoacyl-[acyl-carrier protein] reductase